MGVGFMGIAVMRGKKEKIESKIESFMLSDLKYRDSVTFPPLQNEARKPAYIHTHGLQMRDASLG